MPDSDMHHSRPRISIIAAIGTHNRVLGKEGQLLWHIPDDLKRFKEITSGHPVIMGRKTWESLPGKFRPLPGRLNLVVTRQPSYEALGAETCPSLEAAIEKAVSSAGTESEIFIIGGSEIYREVLPLADKLYLTLIDEDKEGDVFFPEYEHVFIKKTFEEHRTYKDLEYSWIDFEHT